MMDSSGGALKAFAARLREVRKKKRNAIGLPLSQRRAAQLFNVDAATYSNWENARNLPDPRSREAIAREWPEVFDGQNLEVA